MKSTRRSVAAAILAGLLPGSSHAVAQSPSDLLQKAIYTQETVGDLDGAIQLYKRVVTAAKDVRPYGAQAQYRLGLCLLKKGNPVEAATAFKAVIDQYPEQTDFVAKAREQLAAGVDLSPAPWTDGEILDYRLIAPGGMVAATHVVSVDSGAADSWQIKTCMYLGVGTMKSRIEVRRDNMRPIESWYRNFMMGDAHAVYQPTQVKIDQPGKSPITVDLDKPVYDNDSFYSIVRRLPLAPGYKTSFRVISPLGATPVDVSLQVLGVEDVQTPAGKFQAHKAEISVMRQTFWVANDARHLLVKYEAPGMTAELAGIRQRNRLAPFTYADAKGYTVELPTGWLTQPGPTPAKDTVLLLDPEAVASVIVWSGDKAAETAALESSLRKEADQTVEGRLKSLADFKERAASRQTRQINGRTALSLVADFSLLGKPMVEYITWVRTENMMTQFRVLAAPGEFETARKRIDPIIESTRLK
ncbi:MAG: DUF3108 domain-containing protein [Bryobacterales bacterium]|nr:DUF3108 domain-containing protein [Bryobacterales bacterium]